MDTTKEEGRERINFKYHHANSIIRSKVTSIKKRLYSKGYLDERETVFYLANKGSVPMCCWELNGKGQIKCDSSDFMDRALFVKHCLECQKYIADKLDVRK